MQTQAGGSKMRISGLSIIGILTLILFVSFYGMIATNVLDMARISSQERGDRSWGSDKTIGGINFANNVLEQQNPSIISDRTQYIYCAWQDNRDGDWSIYFSKTANAGAIWSTNISVSNYTLSNGNQFNPSIALNPINNSRLYLAWQDERNDDGDIYFSYTQDRGDTWYPETRVNPIEDNPKQQMFPAVACDAKGTVFVVWTDYTLGNGEILLSSTSDLGATWATPVWVNNPLPENKEQQRPAIGIDSNNIIYVSWEDDRNGDKQIYFSRSLDGGRTFIDETLVSPTKLFTSTRNPRIYIDKYDNIFLVWLEDDNSLYNVYFTKSLDHGKTFSIPIRVNDFDNSCSADAEPSVLSDDSGNVYVGWADIRKFNHIYLAQSVDNGNTFTVNEKIDDAQNISATGISETTQEQLPRGNVQLVQLQNRLFAFWSDYINDPNPDDLIPTNSDIYYDWNFTRSNQVPEKPQFVPNLVNKDWYFINITWKISNDLDFEKYILYRSTVKDFKPNQAATNFTINNRLQNYFNNTGLLSGRTYYFLLQVFDSGGLSNISSQLNIATKVNIPPIILLNEPNGSIYDLIDESYIIKWSDSDPDDNATISLFYDNNQNPTDGYNKIVIVPYGEDSEIDNYIWDTSQVKNGSYYIVAVISDPVNGEQYPIYSPGKLKIYHGNLDPWLAITFLSPKNATEVELDTEVVVLFNKKVDMTTIHIDSFYLMDSDGNKVLGKYSIDQSRTKITFTPGNKLKGLELYNITLTTSIKDSTGMFRLYKYYDFWFETRLVSILNGTVIGEVMDEYYKPIDGAMVTLVDVSNQSLTWNTVTNSEGVFYFNVNYGKYNLYVEVESYQKVTILDLNLSRQLLDLSSIKMIRPELVEYSIETNIQISERLTVTATATHPNSEALTYLWDFGDGTNQSGQSVSHKYKKTGEYEVKLTVIDSNYGYITITETVKVEEDEFGPEYLMGIMILSLIILIIGLVVIALVVHLAQKKRQSRIKELGERKHEKGATKKKGSKNGKFNGKKTSRKKNGGTGKEKGKGKEKVKGEEMAEEDEFEELEDEEAEVSRSELTEVQTEAEFELEEPEFAEDLPDEDEDTETELEVEAEVESELKKEPEPVLKKKPKTIKKSKRKKLKTRKK